MSLTAPPRPTPQPARRSRAVALLVALAIGAGLAIAFVLIAAPSLAAPATPRATTSSVPAAAPARPVATRAVVLASASCLDRGAHDVVALRTPDGAARTLPLDACGSQVGEILAVEVVPGDPAVHLAGTGATTTAHAGDASPMGTRLAVTLTVVAAVGTAGLLVAVGRERMAGRRRSPRVDGPGRAPDA